MRVSATSTLTLFLTLLTFPPFVYPKSFEAAKSVQRPIMADQQQYRTVAYYVNWVCLMLLVDFRCDTFKVFADIESL